MHRRQFLALGLVPLARAAAAQGTKPSADARLVYLGTYTGEKSKGIYVSRLDSKSGALSTPALAAEIASPSFLAVHPSRDFLYAVSEINTFEGKPAGSVAAFRIDRQTGMLSPLNQQSSGGRGPAHLIVDPSGRNVLVANYGGGSVAVLPIEKDGRLGPASGFVQHTGSSVNPSRQKEPHAHSINVDPANRFAYVADLGIDKVMIYRFDAAKGTLAAADPAFASVRAGAGPRHFAFHPSGRFAYVINELDCTVTAFACNANTGALEAVQTTSTLPAGQAVASGYSTAEVQVHPSGRFLYGSNRGHDTIVAFSIDQASGQLTHLQHQSTGGSTPRGFGIDPAGAFLFVGNQRSDSLVVLRIDAQTGRLTPTGQTVPLGSPVCVKFA